MPRRITLAAIALFGAHLAWAARIGLGETPLSSRGQMLVSADLVVVGMVATVGVLLGRTPWTRRLALWAVAAQAIAALTHSIDGGWVVAAALSTAAGLGLAPAPSGRWFAFPPREPVPAKATALALSLLAFPSVIGATGRPQTTVAGLVAAGLALGGAWAYSRAMLSGLWFGRVGLPIAIVAAAIGLAVPSAALLIGAAAAVTWLAWTSDARVAAGPLVRSHAAVPVLPEMVPPEILEAAGFDPKGRRKDRP